MKAYKIDLAGVCSETGKRRIFIIGKTEVKNNQQIKEINKKAGINPTQRVWNEKQVQQAIVMNPAKLKI